MIGISLDIQAPPCLGRRGAVLTKRGRFHLMEGLGHLSLAGHHQEIVNARIAAIIREELGM